MHFDTTDFVNTNLFRYFVENFYIFDEIRRDIMYNFDNETVIIREYVFTIIDTKNPVHTYI